MSYGTQHADTGAPALETALRAGPFHVALRAAITARGLPLHRVQHHLTRHGVTVGVTSLSYWQQGARRPQRTESLRAVRALEEILDLPDESLIRLLARDEEHAACRLPRDPLLPLARRGLGRPRTVPRRPRFDPGRRPAHGRPSRAGADRGAPRTPRPRLPAHRARPPGRRGPLRGRPPRRPGMQHGSRLGTCPGELPHGAGAAAPGNGRRRGGTALRRAAAGGRHVPLPLRLRGRHGGPLVGVPARLRLRGRAVRAPGPVHRGRPARALPPLRPALAAWPRAAAVRTCRSAPATARSTWWSHRCVPGSWESGGTGRADPRGGPDRGPGSVRPPRRSCRSSPRPAPSPAAGSPGRAAPSRSPRRTCCRGRST